MMNYNENKDDGYMYIITIAFYTLLYGLEKRKGQNKKICVVLVTWKKYNR